jgi:UDP-2,3-diacylglucosamine hydrolase
MKEGKKIYFASDFHLGVPDKHTSREREKRIIRWLDEIKHDAEEIFLVGDIFDFWFEYKKAIPKGFVRIQGKIAELTDSGIPVHYFTGNHDMWVFDYIPEELGVQLHREPIERTFSGKKFLIGHGDGLGPGDSGYKFIKKVFASKTCQWFFGLLHPNIGIGLADFWSGRSRVSKSLPDEVFLGEDKEWLILYCKEVSATRHFDYFIFGHRHLPLDIKISEHSRYINLGDWIRYNTYAVFDGNDLQLKKFESVVTADSTI